MNKQLQWVHVYVATFVQDLISPCENTHSCLNSCVSRAGKYPAGCAAFRLVSPNVELEESGIKEDKEQSEEQTYTEVRVRDEDVTV